MEAVQQFPGDGHGFVPQFSRDMLLPLMSTDAPSTPGRLDGRHHDSVVAPIADAVLNRVVPPAREYDHGPVLEARGPAYDVLSMQLIVIESPKGTPCVYSTARPMMGCGC